MADAAANLWREAMRPRTARRPRSPGPLSNRAPGMVRGHAAKIDEAGRRAADPGICQPLVPFAELQASRRSDGVKSQGQYTPTRLMLSAEVR